MNTETYLSKEETLIEALPYIQRYEGKTFVVKYGGAAMTDAAVREEFARDVTLLQKIGIRIVLVHGGGPAITELEQKLGTKSKFVGGLRYTDKDTLRSVLMSLAGLTNKELVHHLIRSGANAIGLSGIDGTLLVAKKQTTSGADLGYVGTVTNVNVEILEDMLAKKIIPVIAPVALGADDDLLNVNADEAAAAIAAALGAEKLFFLSDTNGVILDDELVPTLTRSRAEQYIKKGVITKGMIPKVHSGFRALDGSVKKVHIIGGASHSLLLEIFTHEGVGTQIINDESPAAITVHKKSSGEKVVSLLDFKGLDKEKLFQLFYLADALQENKQLKPLAGKSIAILFQKPSLRTRVSFEVGVAELGGTPVVLGNETVGLGSRESVADVARVLERYSDAIVARVFGHNILEEFAAVTNIPIVNALSDLLHPCQILADAYTLYRHGKLHEGMKVAFIGDGNNVANSWIELAQIFPIDLFIACPKGFEPAVKQFIGADAAGSITITNDPKAAAQSADAIYTDVWTSMGQEEEYEKRINAFAGFQITQELLSLAKNDCAVMHCLPAHRGEEITSEVLDSENSIVFDQAENRLHIQKAVLTWLLAPQMMGKNDGSHTQKIYEQTTTAFSDQGDHLSQKHRSSGRTA
ncbi:MAG TPA: ornithine carbamoyltransferase [Candidatus Kapabacteria bacterium]|nr:ornithine carbamoyltransferase [Candidatus Kapabacteria bacterium]